eukprot:3756640-Rhodomonas_salina.1
MPRSRAVVRRGVIRCEISDTTTQAPPGMRWLVFDVGVPCRVALRNQRSDLELRPRILAHTSTSCTPNSRTRSYLLTALCARNADRRVRFLVENLVAAPPISTSSLSIPRNSIPEALPNSEYSRRYAEYDIRHAEYSSSTLDATL